ncbi:MAG: aspartate/glutamate racemase family protein [Acidobacteriota bacterium]
MSATILYQIPGDMTAGPLGAPELDRRRAILQHWAGPETVVEVADSPGGPLSIESHADEALAVAPKLTALRGRPQPPDAVIVGCFGDPGLAALRETLECPVVGPLEASMHLGAQLGARVGIVTVLDSVIPMLDQLVRGMGLSLRYAGAVAIDVPVLALGGNPDDVAARVAEAACDLIERRDADVIVLGCMSLAFLGIAETARPHVETPIVNRAQCALEIAQALVAQQLTSSRRTFVRLRKPPSARGR